MTEPGLGWWSVWKQKLPHVHFASQTLRYVCVCVCSVTKSCLTLVTPWTAAHQAPLSMGFPKHEYGSGLPSPSPEDLPDPGFKPTSPVSPALACGFFTTEPPGKSYFAWKIYGFNRQTHSESKPVTTTCIPSLIKFIWWIFTEHHHILGTSQESAVNKAGRGKEQGSTNAFCGGPESKYFRLWGQQVCHNSSSALTEPKQPLEICKQMCMAAFQ